MFRSLAIAASGLSAQRQRMETIAGNIANAETTHGPDGGAYKRRITQLAAGDGTGVGADGVVAPGQPIGGSGPFHGVNAFAVPSGQFPVDGPRTFQVPVLETNGPDGGPGATGMHIAGVVEDSTDGPLVYEPGHPDADKNGYVRYPNVRITDELVDMMDARHVYEANATVFQSAKAMLKQALDI
jgi:flagellar basal-body rod protein FlgC